ncbi:MAG: MFS transporter [Rubrobacter sp.]|nr:MFS transporter [Rubrobacter sp.]
MSKANTVETQVPARIDRLPWSRWHTLVILALGVTWILDGLEITIQANIADTLTDPVMGLGLSASQVGYAAGIYIAGACLGALFFSYLTDRYGRRRMFLITLSVYLIFTVLTAFSWNFFSFALFRFLTGTGIGGEYSAIYSAIDELIPARLRGQLALFVSGTYWVGAIAASLLTIVLLNPNLIDQFYGWRIAFTLGALLSLGVLLIRRYVPESPRWLMTHGRAEDAERVAREIEDEVRRYTGRVELPPPEEGSITVEQREAIGFEPIARAMFQMYPVRTILGLVLMTSQAFLYNAIFFTAGLVLGSFFDVPSGSIPYYLVFFALGNLLGPILLGPLFDRVGRRSMITTCYLVAGALMALTAYLFAQDIISAPAQTALWVTLFFFASAAASAAYLTVSEVFPMEIRAMAIALFYAVGTALGGVTGPIIFGQLIGTGNRGSLVVGYLVAASLMVAAAMVELALGVRAERRSLESIAAPLTAIRQETGPAT